MAYRARPTVELSRLLPKGCLQEFQDQLVDDYLRMSGRYNISLGVEPTCPLIKSEVCGGATLKANWSSYPSDGVGILPRQKREGVRAVCARPTFIWQGCMAPGHYPQVG
jgi:hypothetical protein